MAGRAGAYPQGGKKRLRPLGDRELRTQVKDAWAAGAARSCSLQNDQYRGWGRKSERGEGPQLEPSLWVLLPRDPTVTVFLGTLCSGCESWLKHATLAELQLPV